MPTLIPGLSVTESSQPTLTLNRSRLTAIIIPCTRTTIGSGADLSLQRINSISEVATKIGTVPAVVQGAIERIFAIAPSAEIYMIPSDTGATAVLKLVAAINAILTKATALDIAVTVCPEAATLSAQADRTSCWTAGEAVASTNGWDWLYFQNLGSVTNTKTLADTESLLLTSAQGNSSKYYGFSKDASNRDIPLAVDAAAWLVQLAQTRDLFRSPAGLDCPIPATSIDPQWLLSFAEANDVMTGNRGYNFPWAIRGTNYIWNCVTGACLPSVTDQAWWNINSRLSLTTLQARLASAVATMFQPSNLSTGNNSALGKIASVQSIVSQWSDEGGTAVPPLAADGTQPPPFRVVPINVSSGQQSIQIRCYPIQSDREIRFDIISTTRV